MPIITGAGLLKIGAAFVAKKVVFAKLLAAIKGFAVVTKTPPLAIKLVSNAIGIAKTAGTMTAIMGILKALVIIGLGIGGINAKHYAFKALKHFSKGKTKKGLKSLKKALKEAPSFDFPVP